MIGQRISMGGGKGRNLPDEGTCGGFDHAGVIVEQSGDGRGLGAGGAAGAQGRNEAAARTWDACSGSRRSSSFLVVASAMKAHGIASRIPWAIISTVAISCGLLRKRVRNRRASDWDALGSWEFTSNGGRSRYQPPRRRAGVADRRRSSPAPAPQRRRGGVG